MTAISRIVVVRNIPSNFHSSDLRFYFSSLVEAEAFECFHYRHRPEIVQEPSQTRANEPDSAKTSDSKIPASTRCCFVKVRSKHLKDFLSNSGKNWTQEKGGLLSTKCHIIVMKIPGNDDETENPKKEDGSDSSVSSPYLTRQERRIEQRYHLHHQDLKHSDVDSLLEMNPPVLMPQGNVGTPTKHFLLLIQKCQMPSSLIKSLGLRFPKGRRNRKYGQVPMDYGTGYVDGDGDLDSESEEEDCTVRSNHMRWTERATGNGTSSDDVPVEDREDADNDECEEWERHEALNDDVTTHERNKERLFEDEQEVVWEKGGPGIVWNMDANYWKEQAGGSDLDESTDDWDVDMSIYYEDESDRPGDSDARDFLQIRREREMRTGTAPSIFRQPRPPSPSDDSDKQKIGEFEKHTRAFGRKMMEKSGWREGRGLGQWKEGMADALTGEGQQPWSKRGVGYVGPALGRRPVKRLDRELTAINRSAVLEAGQTGVRITACFDVRDGSDTLKRRTAPTNLKYRKKT